MAYGEEETTEENKQALLAAQQKRKEEKLSLVEEEVKAFQAQQDSLHTRLPQLSDQSGQVRIAIYGLERPKSGAPIEDLLWYCTGLISRIPAASKEEMWQRNRTFVDLTDRSSGSVNDETLRKNIMDYINRLESMIATADDKAMGGITGIQAITTSTRYERVDQNIRQVPLPTAPGLFEGIINKITGGGKK
jgi:hypothetical protein